MEKIYKLHSGGLNCAQIVLYHGAERLGLEPESVLKTAACFGGGMQMAETCGCLTGALMFLGLKFGNSDIGQLEQKKLANRAAKLLRDEFIKRSSGLNCHEILGYNITTPEGKKMVAEGGLSRSICEPLMKTACELIDEFIEE